MFNSAKCRKCCGVGCLCNAFCETETGLKCIHMVQAVLRLNSQRQKESPLWGSKNKNKERVGGEERGTKNCLSRDTSQVSGKLLNRHTLPDSPSGTQPWLAIFHPKNGHSDAAQRKGGTSVKAFGVFRQDTLLFCAHTHALIYIYLYREGERRERTTSWGISFTICWVLIAICKVKAFMLFSLCSKRIFLSQWLLALLYTTRKNIQQFGASSVKHWRLRNLEHPAYTVIWQVLTSCLP